MIFVSEGNRSEDLQGGPVIGDQTKVGQTIC